MMRKLIIYGWFFYTIGFLTAVGSTFLEFPALKSFLRGMEAFDRLTFFSLLFQREQIWDLIRSLDFLGKYLTFDELEIKY